MVYENSTIIGERLCRNELPAPLTSSKHELHLRALSVKKNNEDNTVKRFKLKVVAETGRRLFIIMSQTIIQIH